MSAPLPEAIERAAAALIQALGLPCCIQVTLNLNEGRVSSVETRQKFQGNGQNGRDNPPSAGVKQ